MYNLKEYILSYLKKNERNKKGWVQKNGDKRIQYKKLLIEFFIFYSHFLLGTVSDIAKNTDIPYKISLLLNIIPVLTTCSHHQNSHQH